MVLTQATTKTHQHQDLTPATYTGLYSMHKYWAKKPHNIVRDFIERYTRRGHIVLDPFCGSGVTAIESLLSGRKAIACDLNPMATFITRATLLPVNPAELEEQYRCICDAIQERLDTLYLTRCLQCESEALCTHHIWEGEMLKRIWYYCAGCGERKGVKTPDQQDFERLQAIEAQHVPNFYPQTLLYENSRVNAYAGMRVCDLFTKRNLIALSLLLNEIERIEDADLKDVLKFTFTSCVAQTSKMVFVVRQRGKMNGRVENKGEEVGSWVAGYWVPRERFEVNVWRCFGNRFRKVLRGKREVFARLRGRFVEAQTYQDLTEGSRILISTQSATDLFNLPDESVDYIFTDPPHGDRIPYLELSLMWMSWLRMTADFESEIVVSDAKQRNKDTEDYCARLALAFREMYRVLRRGKYMSVAFNSWDDKAWHAFLSSCSELGFEMIDVTPVRYSANSVMQDTRRGGLRGDFVVTFLKRSKRVGRLDVPAILNGLKPQRTITLSKLVSHNDTGEAHHAT